MSWMGKIEKVGHMAIQAGCDLELRHTKPGLCKNLRFICLKGACEGANARGQYTLRTRWWNGSTEFEGHCRDLKPFGFDYSEEPTTKETCHTHHRLPVPTQKFGATTQHSWMNRAGLAKQNCSRYRSSEMSKRQTKISTRCTSFEQQMVEP